MDNKQIVEEAPQTPLSMIWNMFGQNQVKESPKPATFSKKRKVTVNKLPNTEWISALQLSLWDNISGPKVEQMWIGEHEIGDEVQLYIARHTLCGEISQGESDLIETKFHVFPELGYIVTASLFHALHMRSQSKFSLSLLIDRKHLQKYLLLHSIIEDRLLQLVQKLRALLEKSPQDAMELFSTQLDNFVNNLELVYGASLPRLDFTKTLFADPSLEDNSSTIEFLARAVTSHLQTHGCTVVVGEDLEMINKVVDTLSLFLISGNERKRSCHATINSKYVADLVLQGILANSISDEEIIESLLPTTLVDVKQQIVKQTHPFHEYNVLRREFLSMSIEKLTNTKKRENLWTAQDSLFRPVRNSSPYIARILTDVTSLPVPLREAYIAQSMKLLVRKAVLLVRYVGSLLEKVNSSNIEANALKRLRFDLDINSEQDFSVLLGIAEKLSPGTYVALAGDPASIEEKFIELFESF